MSLTNHAFFLLFLPISLLVYWCFFKTNKARLRILLGISLLFYALGGWEYIPLLLGLSLLTFHFAKKSWFNAGIIINILGLVVFKLLSIEAVLWKVLGNPNAEQFFAIAIPLGLSYYTFKHISYLLDVKWGVYSASENLLVFFVYSSFFPQISAGPLTNFHETSKQLKDLPQRLKQSAIYNGLIYIVVGLTKKLLIANVLAEGINKVTLSPLDENAGFINAFLLVISTIIQIYFDFSGYTDLVIGVAKLFGIQLPENFNNPFLAKTTQEFWNRWHITLSKWFKVYVFFPLSRILIKRMGVSKKGQAQAVANLVTMSVVGLWHGTTFGNVAWGILMGLVLNLEIGLKRRRKNIKSNLLVKILFFLFIITAVGLFMSPDFGYAVALFSGMIGLRGFEGLSVFNIMKSNSFYSTLILALVITFSGVAEAKQLLFIRNKWFAIGIGVLLVICIIAMGKSVDFFYVQF